MNIHGWRGGPNLFTQFDLDYAGTGEGGQAQGNGIYLAGTRHGGEYYTRNAIPTRAGGTAYLYELHAWLPNNAFWANPVEHPAFRTPHDRCVGTQFNHNPAS